VQVYVSQLRKALRKGVLATRPAGYVLHLEPGALDAARFEGLLEEGRRLLADGEATPTTEVVVEALALWRGPALAEFRYEDFARDEIARLDGLRLVGVETRLEADLALGRHAEAIPEIEALVREYPLRESLRRLLMLALYRAGRQADALAAYQDARTALVEELGIEPSESLRQLEAAILRHDSALDLAGQAEHAERAEPPIQAIGRSVNGDQALPTGTVTMLFTDIEGSTELVKQLGERYGELLSDHRRLLRAAVAAHGGREMDNQGDAFFFAFQRACDAEEAAIEAQRVLTVHKWPGGVECRVRMGVHTGEPSVGDEGYHGIGLHRGARIAAAAHGGQILVSNSTRELIEDELPAGVALRDLGEQRLKDIARQERIYQLVVDGLASEFPPVRAQPAEATRSSGRLRWSVLWARSPWRRSRAPSSSSSAGRAPRSRRSTRTPSARSTPAATGSSSRCRSDPGPVELQAAAARSGL
jgi:class 3 adenylate cyclase